MKLRETQLVFVSASLLLFSCKPTTIVPKTQSIAATDSAEMPVGHNVVPFAHGVTVYVSGTNCEMTVRDASRINQLAATTGIVVEVVFVGIPGNDTLVAQNVRRDLGLTVPSRVVREGELAAFKSVGIARMPMALVIKGKQLSTIVSGEVMLKTLGLIEAAFSPKVGH